MVTTRKQITERLNNGAVFDDEGSSDILEFVYDELRRQAHRFLSRERRGHTLQTTALVNEAYLKLNKQRKTVWESRAHFFSIAATMMRRILVDHARAKRREKRGGKMFDLPIEAASEVETISRNVDLLDLDEALHRLAERDKRLARVVELRFFAGLDLTETAKIMNASESTVKRDWRMARAWLHRELSPADNGRQ